MSSAPSLPDSPSHAFPNPGRPWGDLELVEIIIAPPTDFTPVASIRNSHTDWCLDGGTLDQVANIMAVVGLSSAEISEGISQFQVDPDGHLHLFPSQEWIEALPLEKRIRLYSSFAARFPRSPHANSFRFCGASVDDWLGDANLRDSSVEAVRPHVYRRGAFLFFADLPLVLSKIPDDGERINLVKALSRESTMLIKLQLNPQSDVDQLEAYWGWGRRNKDLRPILESLSRFRDGQLIDIVHLLPPFARRLLYTYPQPPKSSQDGARDCHWTSLNFFKEVSDDGFLELDYVVRTIETQYYQSREAPRFGDLVLFSDVGGEVFHSAIYIADDIVFTKNGPTISRPWMFMKMDTMRDFYPRQSPTELRYFRRRDLAGK